MLSNGGIVQQGKRQVMGPLESIDVVGILEWFSAIFNGYTKMMKKLIPQNTSKSYTHLYTITYNLLFIMIINVITP